MKTITKAGLLVGALMLSALVSTGHADATRYVKGAKPGDCVACHGDAKVFGAKNHRSTKDMTRKDCLKCHEPGTENALEGKLPGMHTHLLAGESCASCHGDAAKPSVMNASRAQCVKCHDAGKLVATTAGVKPLNPHESPHWGTEMECSACHTQHGKTVDYCDHCHEFGFKVP